jgi:hypothetical protein
MPSQQSSPKHSTDSQDDDLKTHNNETIIDTTVITTIDTYRTSSNTCKTDDLNNNLLESDESEKILQTSTNVSQQLSIDENEQKAEIDPIQQTNNDIQQPDNDDSSLNLSDIPLAFLVQDEQDVNKKEIMKNSTKLTVCKKNKRKKRKKRKFNNYDAEIVHKRPKTRDLQQEVRDLQRQLQEANKTITIWQSSEEINSQKIDKLTDEIKIKEAAKVTINNELHHTRQVLQKLRTKIKAIKEQNINLNDDNQLLNLLGDQLETEQMEVDNDLNDTRQEVTELQEQLENAKQTINTKYDEIEEITVNKDAEIKYIQDLLDNERKINEELKQQIKDVDKDNKSISSTSNEKYNTLKIYYSDVLQKNKTMIQSIKNRDNQMKTLQEQIKCYQQLQNKLNETHVPAEEHTECINDLKDQLKKSDNVIKQLKTAKENKQQQYQSNTQKLQKQISIQDNSIKQLKTKNNNDITAVKQQLQQLQIEREQLLTDKNTLQNEIINREQTIDIMKQTAQKRQQAAKTANNDTDYIQQLTTNKTSNNNFNYNNNRNNINNEQNNNDDDDSENSDDNHNKRNTPSIQTPIKVKQCLFCKKKHLNQKCPLIRKLEQTPTKKEISDMFSTQLQEFMQQLNFNRKSNEEQSISSTVGYKQYRQSTKGYKNPTNTQNAIIFENDEYDNSDANDVENIDIDEEDNDDNENDDTEQKYSAPIPILLPQIQNKLNNGESLTEAEINYYTSWSNKTHDSQKKKTRNITDTVKLSQTLKELIKDIKYDGETKQLYEVIDQFNRIKECSFNELSQLQLTDLWINHILTGEAQIYALTRRESWRQKPKLLTVFRELKTQFQQKSRYNVLYRKWLTFKCNNVKTPLQNIQDYEQLLSQMKIHYKIEKNYVKTADITNCPLNDYNRLSRKLLESIRPVNINFYEKVLESLDAANSQLLDNDYSYTQYDYEVLKGIIEHTGRIKCRNNQYSIGGKPKNINIEKTTKFGLKPKFPIIQKRTYSNVKRCRNCNKLGHYTTECWYIQGKNKQLSNNNKNVSRKFNYSPNNNNNKNVPRTMFVKKNNNIRPVSYQNNNNIWRQRYNNNWRSQNNNNAYNQRRNINNNYNNNQRFINNNQQQHNISDVNPNAYNPFGKERQRPPKKTNNENKQN